VRDTTVVELHRLARSPIEVRAIVGEAYRVSEDGVILAKLSKESKVSVGETIALDPGSVLLIDRFRFAGGRRGKAIAFVAETAFRSSPSRSDVPKLLDQLKEIDRQMLAQLGEDPLRMHKGPSTPFERATSAEFAELNLVERDARELPEPIARATGAVCLFFSDEAAFVAFSSVTIAKLRTLMEALNRPVNPHLVEEHVLEQLQQRVYAPRRDEPS
jgi:hypothetical protein